MQIKKHCQIKNSAAAFLKLMELARIGLEKLKEEEALQGGEVPHQEACHGLA